MLSSSYSLQYQAEQREVTKWLVPLFRLTGTRRLAWDSEVHHPTWAACGLPLGKWGMGNHCILTKAFWRPFVGAFTLYMFDEQ